MNSIALKFLAGTIGILLSATLTAGEQQWHLMDVAFDDGGTAAGSFTFDASKETFTDFSIDVSGGNTGDFPPIAYTFDVGSSIYGESGGFFFHTFRAGGSNREFRIVTSQALTDAGGTVPLNLDGTLECFNCSPARFAVSGFLTTEVPTVIDGTFSGSWYNPDRNFEGQVLEFFEIAAAKGQNTVGVVGYWYTYMADETGDPLWIFGAGSVVGDTATIDEAFMGMGGQFGPAYDPDDVTLVPFGSMTFQFSGCRNGVFSWNSTNKDFGSGTYPIVKIAPRIAVPLGTAEC